MDQLTAFRILLKEIGAVVIGEGRRHPRDEEQKKLRRMCDLSVELYEKGSIDRREFSWASTVARKFFLMSPYEEVREDDGVVEYLGV